LKLQVTDIPCLAKEAKNSKVEYNDYVTLRDIIEAKGNLMKTSHYLAIPTLLIGLSGPIAALADNLS